MDTDGIFKCAALTSFHLSSCFKLAAASEAKEVITRNVRIMFATWIYPQVYLLLVRNPVFSSVGASVGIHLLCIFIFLPFILNFLTHDF